MLKNKLFTSDFSIESQIKYGEPGLLFYQWQTKVIKCILETFIKVYDSV